MKMGIIWRIYHDENKEFFKGHRQRSTWAFKSFAIRSFKTRNGGKEPKDCPGWRIIKYALVEIHP